MTVTLMNRFSGDAAFKKAQATLDKSAKLEERTFLRGVATLRAPPVIGVHG